MSDTVVRMSSKPTQRSEKQASKTVHAQREKRLYAAMGKQRKKQDVQAINGILDKQNMTVVRVALEYAQLLSSLGIAEQDYLHGIALYTAKLPEDSIRAAWRFLHELIGKNQQQAEPH